MPTVELSRFERAALVALLGHGFDRGVVYPRNRDDRKLLKKAVRLGLVDGDGGVTASGEAFVDEALACSSASPSPSPAPG